PRVLEASESADDTLKFFIQASVPSDTCDVQFYDLILMPTNEWSFVASTDSAIVSTDLAALNLEGDMLECDSGVVRRGSTYMSGGSSNRIERFFESRGQPPRLPPD